MNIAIYGGSFDPPHLGHIEAARTAAELLKPDKLLIVPNKLHPKKTPEPGSPTAEERLTLCKLAFAGIDCAEISDVEIKRGGVSYTADTVEELKGEYPDASFTLLLGADMLQNFENWYQFDTLIGSCATAVFPRTAGEDAELAALCRVYREKFGARIEILKHSPLPVSSAEIRGKLKNRCCAELLPPAVYAEIIRKRYYAAKPELSWLRGEAKTLLKPKRIPHVLGCEEESVRLALRWGADPDTAAEAAILHDCTKKLNLHEQLNLCRKCGIMPDEAERESTQLLHSKSGAALARECFGVNDTVYDAIRWHTTGRPDMSLLEKILYLADVIEPTRDFPGVNELRRLACEDLDHAMLRALEMSLENLHERGIVPHENTLAALEWLRKYK